jgi:threonine dehydratase
MPSSRTECRILKRRVHDPFGHHPGVTGPTPLKPAPASLTPRRDVLLKREDVHELGAFKWRGALPALRAYRARGADAVVTASTGNHGAATAWAARRLGIRAIVYAPAGASRSKLAAIKRFGAEARLAGNDLDEAKDEARALADAEGLAFFEDGAEPTQFTGYATIAREILDQLRSPPAAVVVPVGNGALLGGVGRELGRLASGTLRVGVAAREAPVMVESWLAGRVVEADRAGTFADGLAVRVAIPYAVDVLADVAGRMLLVSERAIARAVGAYARAGIRVEGAAGAALAALPQLEDVEGPIVLIVTGRNIDDSLWRRAVEQPESFPD